MLRRAIYRGCCAVPLVVLAVFLPWSGPSVAWAHASLVRAAPPPDSLLPRSPHSIHLWFGEDLNGSASRIVVWDHTRRSVTRGPATGVPGHPRELQAALDPLPSGSYLVMWTSVSSEDGHVLQGSYVFSVGRRGPAPSLSGLPGEGNSSGFPDWFGITGLVAHWMELLGAVTWAGTAAFSSFVFSGVKRQIAPEMREEEYRRFRLVAWVSLGLVTASSFAVLLLQAYNLAGDWSSIFARTTLGSLLQDHYGEAWVGRQVVALVAVTFSTITPPRSARTVLSSEGANVQTIAAALYLYVFAAGGHAASAHIGVLPGDHTHFFSLSVFVDWLHLLADALWFGGQIAIVLILVPALKPLGPKGGTGILLDCLSRFSPWAYTCIAFYVLSGGFNGAIHIPSLYYLFHSVYGWSLLAKLILVGFMLLTSAYTVFILRPAVGRSLGTGSTQTQTAHYGPRLLPWLHVNPVLGLGVLLATSVMFYYPVPSPLAATGSATRPARRAVAARIHPCRSGRDHGSAREKSGCSVPRAMSLRSSIPRVPASVPVHRKASSAQ